MYQNLFVFVVATHNTYIDDHQLKHISAYTVVNILTGIYINEQIISE